MVGAFSVQILCHFVVFLPVAAARFGITHALGLGSVRSSNFHGVDVNDVASRPVVASDVIGVIDPRSNRPESVKGRVSTDLKKTSDGSR